MEKPEKTQEGGPDAQAIAAMREHREGEHRRAFDLVRHVDYPGQKRKRAPMTYVPAAPGRGAHFYCRLCPGLVFPVGDPFDYSDPATQQRWLRRHPDDAPGILKLPPEQRGRAIAAHQSGEVAALAYEQWLAKGLQRTVPKGRRAEDAARIEGCQRQMLAERLEGKPVEEIIERLLRMQVKEPGRWHKLTGAQKTVTEPTLRRYWRKIPKPARDAAAEEAKAQTETGQASALGERLLAALSPSANLPPPPKPVQPGAHAKRPTLPPPGVLQERSGPGARRQR
jgi:hypothetical protein